MRRDPYMVELEKLCEKDLWRTNDKEIISIQDMATEHIKRAIGSVYKRMHQREEWTSLYMDYRRKFVGELNRRRKRELYLAKRKED